MSFPFSSKPNPRIDQAASARNIYFTLIWPLLCMPTIDHLMQSIFFPQRSNSSLVRRNSHPWHRPKCQRVDVDRRDYPTRTLRALGVQVQLLHSSNPHRYKYIQIFVYLCSLRILVPSWLLESLAVVTEANPNRSETKMIYPVEKGVRKHGGESSERGSFCELCDSEYAKELQLQEVLEASVMNMNPYQKGGGESSESFCEICQEGKEAKEMFRIGTECSHTFCSPCISRYVETKVLERVTTIKCPGPQCEGVLQINSCRPILPENVLYMWEKSLCEAMFLESQKFYCPFKNCAALLIKDHKGRQVIRESECPSCHGLFCARCSVPWHAGVSCKEFQSMRASKEEDLTVRELAKKKKWRQCPKCKFFVERTQGCAHITCRCGFQFCYGCGSKWSRSHGGCARN